MLEFRSREKKEGQREGFVPYTTDGHIRPSYHVHHTQLKQTNKNSTESDNINTSLGNIEGTTGLETSVAKDELGYL